MSEINKLRVKNANRYVIEVNDSGDTIEFNIDDPELLLKYDKAFRKIDKIEQYTKEQIAVLEKKEERKQKGALLSVKEKERLEIWTQCFNDMRDAMDEFLGKGACQKIFGDSNYLTMFDDLFEELEPHFIKMGLNADRFKNEVIEKYKDTDDEELS